MDSATPQARDRRLPVCDSAQLAERGFLIVELRYRDDPHTGIVFRFCGKVYAYLNQCVHMPRPLNCQRDTIFDAEQGLLRCSMHGIVYDPETGESLSVLCQGERLRPLKLVEEEGRIYIQDKRVMPPQPI